MGLYSDARDALGKGRSNGPERGRAGLPRRRTLVALARGGEVGEGKRLGKSEGLEATWMLLNPWQKRRKGTKKEMEPTQRTGIEGVFAHTMDPKSEFEEACVNYSHRYLIFHNLSYEHEHATNEKMIFHLH